MQQDVAFKDIDRIYKSLFVYSIGFYEMLSNTVLSHSKHKYSVMGKIWKVFAMLLEFCSKSGYNTLIQKMELEYQQKVSEIQNHCDKEMTRLFDQEKEFRSEIFELKKSKANLEILKDDFELKYNKKTEENI